MQRRRVSDNMDVIMSSGCGLVHVELCHSLKLNKNSPSNFTGCLVVRGTHKRGCEGVWGGRCECTLASSGCTECSSYCGLDSEWVSSGVSSGGVFWLPVCESWALVGTCGDAQEGKAWSNIGRVFGGGIHSHLHTLMWSNWWVACVWVFHGFKKIGSKTIRTPTIYYFSSARQPVKILSVDKTCCFS